MSWKGRRLWNTYRPQVIKFTDSRWEPHPVYGTDQPKLGIDLATRTPTPPPESELKSPFVTNTRIAETSSAGNPEQIGSMRVEHYHDGLRSHR